MGVHFRTWISIAALECGAEIRGDEVTTIALLRWLREIIAGTFSISQIYRIGKDLLWPPVKAASRIAIFIGAWALVDPMRAQA